MDLSEEIKERAMAFMTSVAQRSGDPFYTVSPADNFRFVFINDAGCRHFGRSREEMLTLRLSDVDPLFPPDEWPPFWEDLKEKGAIFFETVHRHADGRDIPVAVSANLFVQGGQELFGGCIHDLREEKRSEEALRESEEMLRIIFNSTYDAILLHTPEGAILDVNESFLRMHRISHEQALRLTVEDLSSPTMSMDTAREIWEKVLAGKPQFFEWKGRRAFDRSEFDVEVFLRKVTIQGRKAILANARDITSRKEVETALRESEEKFRLVFNQQFQFMAVLSPEGIVLEINDLPLRIQGCTREDYVGKPFWESPAWRDLPEWQEIWPERLAQAAQREEPLLTEDVFRGADGSIRFADAATRAVRDAEGRTKYFIIQAVDTTERKQMEQALRQNEERFRYIVHATQDAIYDWDVRKGTVWHNDAYQALYSPQQPVEANIGWWERQLHPGDRTRILERLDNAFGHGDRFWSDEYRFRRFDGTFATVMDRGFIIYDGKGEPVRMIGAMTDVTESRKALNEAQTARDKVAAILKSVADGLLVTDLDDRVLLMNDAAEALFDILLSETSNRQVDSLLPFEDSLRRQIAAVRGGEEEKAVCEWEHKKGGTPRVIQGLTTAMRDSRGRRTGTITLLRDMTRDREIDRIKNEFISTAAHELRTPLTTVTGYLELLQDEERFIPEERKEFLRLVYEKAEVLDRIIRDLLDLSRVQAGKLVTVEKVIEDVTALVRNSVAAYKAISPHHTFELIFPDEPVVLCLDPGKIGQVLDNLLSNAVKFSPAGGTVRVVGGRSDETFEVMVADEGIGMSPEEVARIFDKFYRVDASNTAVSGLGLGMSIVKNIVEAHGGEIWVDSEPGRGTQVHFTLPVQDVRMECARRMH